MKYLLIALMTVASVSTASAQESNGVFGEVEGLDYGTNAVAPIDAVVFVLIHLQRTRPSAVPILEIETIGLVWMLRTGSTTHASLDAVTKIFLKIKRGKGAIPFPL